MTHKPVTRNARFWDYPVRGVVKITLKPGQKLVYHRGGLDEEGWWSSTTAWIHLGDRVQRRLFNDGRDCDGRWSRSLVDECPLDQLSGDYNEYAKVNYPKWGMIDSLNVDEEAEKAGY